MALRNPHWAADRENVRNGLAGPVTLTRTRSSDSSVHHRRTFGATQDPRAASRHYRFRQLPNRGNRVVIQKGVEAVLPPCRQTGYPHRQRCRPDGEGRGYRGPHVAGRWKLDRLSEQQRVERILRPRRIATLVPAGHRMQFLGELLGDGDHRNGDVGETDEVEVWNVDGHRNDLAAIRWSRERRKSSALRNRPTVIWTLTRSPPSPGTAQPPGPTPCGGRCPAPTRPGGRFEPQRDRYGQRRRSSAGAR
ncbi:hypothetical protein BMS3Bbin02_00313 [bacterium BMS3Bbin02]|nr:hypothetical protein BMS3Bbin02_00313 [bacterium BMS3Bbin02]